MSREAFFVGFVAALYRGHATVLATDRSERAMGELARQYPGLYRLIDEEDGGVPGLRAVRIDPTPRAMTSGVRELALSSETVAAIALTSGTTGVPVGHSKTLATLAGSAPMIAQALRLQPGRSSIVATVPPQHMYGLEMTVLLPLWTEVGMHAGRPLYPADVVAALEQVPEPRHLVTTPVHLRALVESTVRLPKIESIVCASAPLAVALAVRAEKLFDTLVIDLYGCTEAGTIATRRIATSEAWTPLAGTRVEDASGGSIVTAPHLPVPVRVSDSVEVSADGTFRLLGRMDDQIKIAGRRTSIAALNSILLNIAGVRDGVFVLVGAKGAVERDRLVAFVVAPALAESDVRAALARNLDPALMPHQLHLVAELPRSATGKLPMAALRELAAAKLATTASA